MTTGKFRCATFEVGDLVESRYFCVIPKKTDMGIIMRVCPDLRIPRIYVWWQTRGRLIEEHEIDLVMVCRNCDTNL